MRKQIKVCVDRQDLIRKGRHFDLLGRCILGDRHLPDAGKLRLAPPRVCLFVSLPPSGGDMDYERCAGFLRARAGVGARAGWGGGVRGGKEGMQMLALHAASGSAHQVFIHKLGGVEVRHEVILILAGSAADHQALEHVQDRLFALFVVKFCAKARGRC